MQRIVRTLASASVLALLMALALAPAASASTLKVDLNPTTGSAVMTSTSVTNIVLSYPANSTLSNYLNGYSANNTASGSFPQGSQGIASLEGHFHDDDGSDITVTNMTVSASYNANANATTLVISKQTTITATVSGVFKVVNGTVTANLGWRGFQVEGALDLPLQGRVFDVNLMGSSVAYAMDGRASGMAAVSGMFGGDGFWNTPTLNFSSLDSPLTTWTQNYNSVSNTTTFSKTISSNSSLSTSYTTNGQTYSLKATSDPSAVIMTPGYATASANSITLAPTPTLLSPVTWAETGFVAALIAFAAIMVVRSKRRAPGLPSSPSTPF